MKNQKAILLMLALAAGETSARAGIVVTIEDPGVQSSTVAGVTTEDFNGFSTGLYSSLSGKIGKYSSDKDGIAIVSPDAYGGANQSRYISVGAQSKQTSYTLTLNSPASYFGFNWQAGDAKNQIQFYNGSTLLATLNVGDVINYISKRPDASKFYGNPNTGADKSEPFAYLNVVDTNGPEITRIVFTNPSSTGFETDNHSVLEKAPEIIPGTTVETLSTPEPSTIASAGLAALVAFGAAKRKGIGLQSKA